MKKELSPTALQELRKLKGFSHQKLADQAGLSKSTIIELEKPPKKPSTAMHSVQERSYEALRKALVATDAQMRGEELATEPFPRKMVTLRSKITTVAQMNYDLVGKQYGISSDQLVQLAPLMFAILVEDSFVWRKEQMELQKQIEQLKKRTQESQYDPDPDLYDSDIQEGFQEEEAAIAVRDVFTTPSAAELPIENGTLSGYASDRFTDFIAAKVQASGGHIKADLMLDYLQGRDIRDPDTKYVAVQDWFEVLNDPDDIEFTAMLRLSLMSGAMRLKDFSAGRTADQNAEWLASEVFPAANELKDILAPEVYSFNAEAEGLGLDGMGFPVRVRRHVFSGATQQSVDQGGDLASD
jgi:transcriptional regulator with XRE-family HTH domain